MFQKCLLILSLVYTTALFSQERRQFCYTKFGENEGLNISYIYSATQDENHQMWFATYNGLYTYDNKRFIKYSPKDKLQKKKLETVLYGAYYDVKTNLIWCSSSEIMLCFDPIKKEFTTPKIPLTDLTELEKNLPYKLYRDSKNKLWFGTQFKGLAYYDEQNNKIKYVFETKNGQYPKIIDIVEDSKSNLWLSTSWGLYEYKNNQLLEHKNSYSNLLSDIEYDKEREVLWIATMANGLLKFNLKNEVFEQHKYTSYHQGKFVNDGIFHSMKFLNKNELLLESTVIYNIQNNTFSLTNTDNFEYEIRTQHVENTVKDIEGNLWFCTYSGLYLLAAQNYHNSTLRVSNPINDFGIEIAQTIAVKQTLYYWSNDYQGIMAYNLVTKIKTSVPLPLGSSQYITSIAYNNHNSIIITTTQGLYEYNVNTDKAIPKKLNTSWENNIINTYCDSENNLWFTVKGESLIKYNTNDNSYVKTIDFKPLKYNLISVVAEDQLNQVWCVSDKGIFSINKSTLKNKHYIGKIDKDAFPIESVNSIAIDNNNHVWFTDNNNGLSEMIQNNGVTKIINHSISPEFGNNFTLAIGLQIDKNNHLWTSTLEGLYCINTNTKKTISILKKQQGLSDNGFNRKILLANNMLVVLDWSMFNLLDLNQYQFATIKPHLYFNNIKIGNELYPFIQSSAYELPYNNGNISMNIGSSGYNNGNQNKYYYQLTGIDKQVQQMKDNYQLSYTGLPPGNYKLNIWVENVNGIVSDIKTIEIKVKPPFYNTWWFYLLLITSLSALVLFIYKMRINAIRKESKLKEEFSKKIAETEMNALRAQMNPHFMFNALNSIQKFILHNETKQASQYLTRFSRLIRLILEQSKSNLIQLQDEVELLNIYTDLEKMRFKQSFDFTIEYNNIDPFQVQIPPMIIQPIIENAIWHGLLHKEEKGEVKLSFHSSDKKTLTIEIQDNGIGRKAAMELKSKNANKDRSFGISIIKDRLMGLNNEQYNIVFIDLEENGIATGTMVRVQLPYNSIS